MGVVQAWVWLTGQQADELDRIFINVLLSIVLAQVLGVAGGAFVIVLYRRMLGRVKKRGWNVCPECMYPLDQSASSGACPECGRGYTHEQLRETWTRF